MNVAFSGHIYCYYFLAVPRPLVKECVTERFFFYFSTKTYVVGTRKNCLNETVL